MSSRKCVGAFVHLQILLFILDWSEETIRATNVKGARPRGTSELIIFRTEAVNLEELIPDSEQTLTRSPVGELALEVNSSSDT